MKRLINLVLGVVLATTSLMAQANVPADVFVKGVADDVLTIVKKDKDIQNGDQEKIFALAEEKILPNFNFDHVCRLVLGKNFSKASKEQQDAFQRE
ncbi:MAG: ABC transporter substrate-binding protein, partial [Methylophilaceae bacterium]|nr:ABC transporter substrate-binding protein [Methylophilaceae bacterium]